MRQSLAIITTPHEHFLKELPSHLLSFWKHQSLHRTYCPIGYFHESWPHTPFSWHKNLPSFAYRIEPHHVQVLLWCGPFGDWNSPFSASLTLGVFPLGFNAFFKKVEICPWRQPTGRFDAVVQTAQQTRPFFRSTILHVKSASRNCNNGQRPCCVTAAGLQWCIATTSELLFSRKSNVSTCQQRTTNSRNQHRLIPSPVTVHKNLSENTLHTKTYHSVSPSKRL
jgi:hypothetical protein